MKPSGAALVGSIMKIFLPWLSLKRIRPLMITNSQVQVHCGRLVHVCCVHVDEDEADMAYASRFILFSGLFCVVLSV